jgi:hypothetical protein
MHLANYLGLLHKAELNLADGFRQVGEAHAAEPDVYHLCHSTVFLAAAIVLALYVVTNILFTSDLALMTAGAAVVVFAALWYVLPMV